jgi:hypothetical protein
LIKFKFILVPTLEHVSILFSQSIKENITLMNT